LRYLTVVVHFKLNFNLKKMEKSINQIKHNFSEPEKKTSKSQTSVYLRHWKPDEYELGELEEIVIEGNTFEILLSEVGLYYFNKISFNFIFNW
jgi:hypothetical protein